MRSDLSSRTRPSSVAMTSATCTTPPCVLAALQTLTVKDILARPELAAKCSVPFTPANATAPATARCCTTDVTEAEFKTLCARMEGSSPYTATNVSDTGFYGRASRTPSWRVRFAARNWAHVV